MSGKSKGLILIQRVLIWALYFFSGFILYSNQGILPALIITFSRIIYPLSIFWLQIRIKKRTSFLPIDSKMTTSQLWFNLLPDAITGNKLNHNCEVVIFESIGRKLVLFLILICNQKIDNG